jgi:ribosomal protein L35
MAIKTTKSFTKRLKVTKTGKILARKPGKNHFNGRKSGRSKINGQGLVPFNITTKTATRFIVQKL